MSDRSIAIRNVYVMMAYAFRSIRTSGAERIAAERFEHLHDLLAEILVRGVGAQVKRGIHRDYLDRSDELAGVRGRIDITRTIARRSTTRARLVCEFDEYEPDTPHNQALKSVMVLLLRHGEVEATRKDELRRLLPHLDAVTLIAPTNIRWSDLTYHRATATYRLLLGVCELIVRGLLPTRDSGATKLTSWVSDEAMSMLYERFLREYYAQHHPGLSPAARTVTWDLDEPSDPSSQHAPDAHRRHPPTRRMHPHHRREVLQPVAADRSLGQIHRPLGQPLPSPGLCEERGHLAQRLCERASSLRAN